VSCNRLLLPPEVELLLLVPAGAAWGAAAGAQGPADAPCVVVTSLVPCKSGAGTTSTERHLLGAAGVKPDGLQLGAEPHVLLQHCDERRTRCHTFLTTIQPPSIA
jgi:hypothetical protein